MDYREIKLDKKRVPYLSPVQCFLCHNKYLVFYQWGKIKFGKQEKDPTPCQQCRRL